MRSRRRAEGEERTERGESSGERERNKTKRSEGKKRKERERPGTKIQRVGPTGSPIKN